MRTGHTASRRRVTLKSETDVLLIYPYFHHGSSWRKFWLFPPLGLGYIAGTLQKNGIRVKILDGTFTGQRELIKKAEELRPKVVGIYCMVTMRDDALKIACALKRSKDKPFIVAGGPYPTSEPKVFIEYFDAVVVGEGETTMLELVKKYLAGDSLLSIDGLVLKGNNSKISTKKREFIDDLDRIPHPARYLFENQKYMQYWQKKFGYTCAPVITTRGCPYNCDYCARPVFGNRYRERGVVDIVEEIEEVLKQGFRRIWFSDDVFTLNRKRITSLCDEIKKRRLIFNWDCLCRVDNVDDGLLEKMYEAGCSRIFFGIESGDNGVMKIMGKSFTVQEAEKAVGKVKRARIEVGTFFMVGYPGETEETILKTIRFSSHLPSDYLSYTLPYPLPGTGLYKRLGGRLTREEWKMAGHNLLMFRGDFSQAKLRFAIYKGIVQHRLRKYGFIKLSDVFEKITDAIFKWLK